MKQSDRRREKKIKKRKIGQEVEKEGESVGK